MLTPERLRELLMFDRTTGIFTWRLGRRGTARAGSIAGNVDVLGYLRIGIDGARYKSHRLAWMYEYGAFPEHQIDHINGDRADNRIDNLRDVTTNVNQQNRRRAHVSNSTGFLGVAKEAHGSRWRAHIGVNGVGHYLGLFKSPEEAHAAYLVQKRRLHEGCTI